MLFSTLTEVSPHTGGMPGQQETQLKETGIKTMQAKSSASKKAHEIKNAAFAFGVYGNNSKRIADVAVTNGKLQLRDRHLIDAEWPPDREGRFRFR